MKWLNRTGMAMSTMLLLVLYGSLNQVRGRASHASW